MSRLTMDQVMPQEDARILEGRVRELIGLGSGQIREDGVSLEVIGSAIVLNVSVMRVLTRTEFTELLNDIHLGPANE